MFSSHIDTVHKEDGINPYKMIQREIDGNVRIRYRAQAECLGADCAAGVALMVSMIHEGVNGYYIFHDGEEQGCLGSRSLAQEEIFLKQFRRAIAFDRKGRKTIITHQAGIETSSPVFANSLRGELLMQGLHFELSERGGVTDVFQYRDVINECSNLSVGYHFAHSAKEWLEYGFLEKMAQACAKVQWEYLYTHRPMVGNYIT
jgi:acetylornithine deacetylase/succinyl-diaminopimelate desuccinylase-like protein